MWQSQPLPGRSHPDFLESAQDLLRSTARRVIVVLTGCYFAWFAWLGMTWPYLLHWQIWLMTTVVMLSAGGALLLLAKRSLLAQLIWQIGIASMIAIAILFLHQPEAAILFVLLPLIAVVSAGWQMALCVEIGVAALTVYLLRDSTTGQLPILGQIVIVVAGLSGLIGWIFSYTLSTVAQWSLVGFEQANTHMREAQTHRAELAQTVKMLDHAYYRLERANTALVAARKAAEEAERFKSEFVANVSHELRTPLNLIIGFSEVMMTSPESYGDARLPRAYRSDLNSIYHSAQHLLALVDDVLDLARIEAGKISLSREEVDLVALVAEATDTVRDYITKKRLQFHVNIEPRLPKVMIDRLRIRQVLLNLLVNAARFTERGSITVDVRLDTGKQHGTQNGSHDAHEESPPFVVIRVRDTGAGIPEMDVPKVFEEFRSTEQPVSKWHSGTGLGLPISKKFIELHRGQIGVESVYGQGATFWFTLPVVSQSPNGFAAPLVQRWAPLVSLGAPERMIVVVHEDERIVALMNRFLEGFQVVGAPTVAEGVALAVELKALALLLDSDQPPPVCPDDMLIMRCPLPSSHQVALALGAVEYMVKPVAYHDLLAVLDRMKLDLQRVLIVDDDPEVVRLFSRMVRTRIPVQGCLEAYTGDEALQLMRQQRPDLVLLDLMMPGLDGKSVLEQKAADPTLAHIPVIIVSANNPDYTHVRLPGAIHLSRVGGLQQGEILRALASICTALAPGWQQLVERDDGQ